MRIIELTVENSRAVEQTARLLMNGFRDSGSAAWDNLDDALLEVKESFQAGRISKVALDEAGDVQGWIGGIEEYDGNVWELHPLVVREDCRKQGTGRALVEDFENEVSRRGAALIQLGTDDENSRTSIGGQDIYPNVLENLCTIKNLREHPFEFYQKLGFEIVGVIPDANGFGKPDILMAKRVSKLNECE